MKKRALVLSTILAACALTPVACSVSSCSADFTGIYVHNLEVVDSLKVKCDPPPSAHVVNVEMDYHTGSNPYTALVRVGPNVTIPRRIGFFVNLNTICLVGWYRAQAVTTVVQKPGDPRVTTTILGKELHISNPKQCKS